MVLEELRKNGISVEVKTGTDGVVEYEVQLRKPEKCNRCNSAVHSRGMEKHRTIYDLIDNSRIEKRRIWLPQYKCSCCAGPDLHDDDKAVYDAILPPRIKLTDDTLVFLIRQLLQKPEYSYGRLSLMHKIGKPVIAASFEAFLERVRNITTDYWMTCNKMAVVRFNGRNEDGVCLFEIKPDTKQVGVIDVMSLKQYISILHRYAHLNFRQQYRGNEYRLPPQSMVCPNDPVLIDAIMAVSDGTIFIWDDRYTNFPEYVIERTEKEFLEQLHAISPNCADVCAAIKKLCSQLDETVRGPCDAFVDDLQGYMYWYHRRAELEEKHKQHITNTIARVQTMRKRGISYENIALQLIFTSDIARNELKGTEFSKYFAEE